MGWFLFKVSKNRGILGDWQISPVPGIPIVIGNRLLAPLGILRIFTFEEFQFFSMAFSFEPLRDSTNISTDIPEIFPSITMPWDRSFTNVYDRFNPLYDPLDILPLSVPLTTVRPPSSSVNSSSYKNLLSLNLTKPFLFLSRPRFRYFPPSSSVNSSSSPITHPLSRQTCLSFISIYDRISIIKRVNNFSNSHRTKIFSSLSFSKSHETFSFFTKIPLFSSLILIINDFLYIPNYN